MKSLKLILGLALGVTGLGGVIAFASTKSEEVDLVEPAEAAGSTTLYINHFNPGSDKGGSWSNFKYYLWGTGGNNGWPGVAFTDSMKTKTPNEFDEYQYVLTIDTSKYQSMVLTGNSDSSWGGAFAKTEDITLADLEGNGLYCGAHKGWQTDANVFAVGTYAYSTKTVYLHDLKGDVYNTKHYCHTFATGKTGTTWPGVAMTKVSGTNNIYSVEINSVLGNVIFNNNGSNQTETIPNVAANDTYIVYPDNGYNKTSIDASRFIDKYMKFETKWLDNGGTGECKSAGWYSSAKSAFSSLTSTVKTAVLAHEPTKYRMEAWARANGDTFNTTTGVFSSRTVSPLLRKDEASYLVPLIIVISIVCVSGCAYFFLRKRKEN